MNLLVSINTYFYLNAGPMSNSKYRPEIDGLRAIAVLSVLFFHFNELWLPGGFVGVDVFFVISGFLITANIYPQLENKSFTFRDFYNRRIKRLLPSLYYLLIICSLVSILILLPEDLSTFNHSLKKIIIFWGNHYFAAGRDYFSPLSNETPLLHTWSLAIEEQFYFIWPILIFIILKLGFKKKSIYLFATVATFLSFFIASVLLVKKYNSWAYYSFPSRYGELLMGSLLAISRFKSIKLSPYFSGLGIILIFLSFFTINGTVSFPGITALLPCIGTLLILSSNNNIFTKWLSYNPIVFIGKISYQLYLWHWPVLAFLRYSTGQYFLSPKLIFFSSLLIFLLSVLVWKFIETPIRYSAMSFKNTFLLLYALPTSLIWGLILISPKLAFKSKIFNKAELTTYGNDICHGVIEKEKCLKGNKQSPRLLVTGDSHAAHLNLFFDKLGKLQNWSAFVVTGSSCSPVINFDEAIISDAEARESCKRLKEYFLDVFKEYEYIAFASRWDFQLGYSIGEKADYEYLEKLKNTFDLLQANNKKVFVFAQIPMRKLSPQRAELVNSRLHLKANAETEETVIKANQIIRNLVARYPDFVWVDTSPIFEEFKDGLFYQNIPVYKDKSHLNIYGSEIVGDKLNDRGFVFFKSSSRNNENK